jgi:hypothetical protein
MQHNKVYLSVNAVRVTSSDKSIKLNHDIFKRYFEQFSDTGAERLGVLDDKHESLAKLEAVLDAVDWAYKIKMP